MDPKSSPPAYSPSNSASSASPSRFELTPNSKVKALLASLDNYSDDENDPGSARANLVSAFPNSTSKEAGYLSNSPQLQHGPRHLSAKGVLDGFEEEEEEDVVRSRGRMAARMLMIKRNCGEGDDSREASPPGTRKTPPMGSRFCSATEDESARTDNPVTNRKRNARVSRSITPQLSSRKEPTSPCLSALPMACPSAAPPENASDSEELPANPLGTDRSKALAEKKRQDALAREKGAAAKRAKNMAKRKRQNAMLDVDEDKDISDDDVERRLTQQARPTRKASKRAQEEITRETQRMSRNQQLTHNAVTKKKISTASLLAKFNYKTTNIVNEVLTEPARSTSSSSTSPHSDFEMHQTPPTSPISHPNNIDKSVLSVEESIDLGFLEVEDRKKVLPDLHQAFDRSASSPPTTLNKGKGRAIEETLHDLFPPPTTKQPLKQPSLLGRSPKIYSKKSAKFEDSDSDLEIVSAKSVLAKSKKLDSIFDRVPAKYSKESSSLHALRMLAQITSPGKQRVRKDKKPLMTSSELQFSLQQRARQQATSEREERLQTLRGKGVYVQTAKEREKEMAEVEDLISKARREGQEIMEREKAAAKERKAIGEVDPLGNSSDDEDWDEDFVEQPSGLGTEGHGSETGDEDEVIGTGTEEDEEEVGDAMEESETELDDLGIADATASNRMFDDEASDKDDNDPEAESSLSQKIVIADAERFEDEEEELPVQQRRRSRKTNVISDDEDEEEQTKETSSPRRISSPSHVHTDSSQAPTSVLRSATKTFIPGLSVAGPAGLGLTQIFAGTMDDSQSNVSPIIEQYEVEHEDPMAFFNAQPIPKLPDFVPTMAEDTQEFVTDSSYDLNQLPESQNDDPQTQFIRVQFSQPQIHGFDSLVEDSMVSQYSEMPEATQDAGFQHMTPISGRFEAPPSTIDTVVLGHNRELESVQETLIVKRKGKLRRRAPDVAALSDDEDEVKNGDSEAEAEEFKVTANVFDVMRKTSGRKAVAVNDFDKKKSGAKELVDEQADESQDEYAGLGGASDDESGGEEDAYAKEIIDDEGEKDVDVHRLAAFFADRERANDERQVEKLYNDITKGMLRRKRGADYDLSDSEDDGETRRKMKRKEFAKMRKALLADERIGKIAENPKRQAFLRAIEDRGSGDDDMSFLNYFKQDEAVDSQSQSQIGEPRIPDNQQEALDPLKRTRPEEVAEGEQRMAPHVRRTKATQKPSSLWELRKSLSNLIEEPSAMMQKQDSEFESEDELQIEGGPKDKENRDPFALRRTNVTSIDRIALQRASSRSLSMSTRLAFAASSSTPGFTVPPLLRRATTNNSMASASSSNSSVSGAVSGMERLVGGSGEGAIKRTGGKNSGVHYFTRETEKRAAIVKSEKRIEQKRSKGAETRRKAVGDLFGGGKFE